MLENENHSLRFHALDAFNTYCKIDMFIPDRKHYLPYRNHRNRPHISSLGSFKVGMKTGRWYHGPSSSPAPKRKAKERDVLARRKRASDSVYDREDHKGQHAVHRSRCDEWNEHGVIEEL